MKCHLYLPYEGIDPTEFESENIYLEEDSYIKALTKEYETTSSVFDMLFGDGNGENLEFTQETKQETKNKKRNYTYSEVDLRNGNETEITVDNLISFAVANDKVVFTFNFANSYMEADFEGEFNAWKNTHDNIRKVNAPKDWKDLHEPTLTFILSFKNLQNEDVYLELANCKIINQGYDGSYLIYADGVMFTNKI